MERRCWPAYCAERCRHRRPDPQLYGSMTAILHATTAASRVNLFRSRSLEKYFLHLFNHLQPSPAVDPHFMRYAQIRKAAPHQGSRDASVPAGTNRPYGAFCVLGNPLRRRKQDLPLRIKGERGGTRRNRFLKQRFAGFSSRSFRLNDSGLVVTLRKEA